MKKVILMMCLAAGAVTIYSCSDDDSTAGSGDYTYKVRMTDAPGPYSAVNVDIQSVAIVDGEGNTVMLDAETGVQNLLELTNGIDMQLASRNLEDDFVSQIKIGLGTNNTVVVDGVSRPLAFSTADGAGLTINVNQTLDADETNEILIDFDANASVVETGVDTYKIVPVIKTIDTSVTGSISGDTNNTSLAIVTATSTTLQSYSTSINSAGNFKLRGLPPGSYTLTVTPILPLTMATQTNVVVQAGQNTVATVITF
ncbi:MAG: DUF4382 domain-containing protein [Flavobacterium sp. JAD_PAG50586_2]|nr:MAG: DUF4382 domain-containing protein [Flavobacterium sp. JAD_PAG50586_2]